MESPQVFLDRVSYCVDNGLAKILCSIKEERERIGDILIKVESGRAVGGCALRNLSDQVRFADAFRNGEWKTYEKITNKGKELSRLAGIAKPVIDAAFAKYTEGFPVSTGHAEVGSWRLEKDKGLLTVGIHINYETKIEAFSKIWLFEKTTAPPFSKNYACFENYVARVIEAMLSGKAVSERARAVHVDRDIDTGELMTTINTLLIPADQREHSIAYAFSFHETIRNQADRVYEAAVRLMRADLIKPFSEREWRSELSEAEKCIRPLRPHETFQYLLNPS